MDKPRLYLGFRLATAIVLAALFVSGLPGAAEAAPGEAGAAEPAPQKGGGDLPLQAVSAGRNHTCGLHPDGSLTCWGLSDDGQTNIPSLPAGLTYTQVSAGGYHTCGLRSDGTLACWGYNTSGQTNIPALPAGLTYTQVSAGNHYTCGLRSDGSLICWGWNEDGQTNVPVLPAGVTYTQVSAGNAHTCGLRSDGSLVCWGWNYDSQTSVPALPLGLTYTQVSAGGYHTCGLRSDGSLICWGWNAYGITTVPVLPAGVTYTQVSTGYSHTCGLRSDGTLACWGANDDGQTSVPVLPAGLTYTQVSAGEMHTCGLRSNGSMACWGSNEWGQLAVPTLSYTQASVGGEYTCGLHPDGSLGCWGDNSAGQANVPSLPYGMTYTQASTGYSHACGLSSDGNLLCWGLNGHGQTNVPALPSHLSYTQGTAGYLHTCGLRSDGSLLCWGWNDDGQSSVPSLPFGTVYTQASAGFDQTCGLRSDGVLLCWGRNDYGQTDVPALTGLTYTQVSAGENHTCGLRSDGGLLCWGSNNEGQTSVPALPAGLTYTQVSAGYLHTCGLRSDGSLLCWGWNDEGRTTVPALPAGLTYTQVSAGPSHTCGVRSDGSLLCWGSNSSGQTNVPRIDYGNDATPPAVVSSLRAGADPSHAASLEFTVTFSEFVVGVDDDDFTLVTTGLTGAAVSGVSGSGKVYTVTVNSGTGDGSLRLDVVANGSIRDVVNLPLGAGFGSGQAYTLDQTAPTLTSFTRQNPAGSPTNADTLVFRGIFSEDVQNVGTADFVVNGTTTATITNVAVVNARTYDITVSGGNLGSFNGTVGVNLAGGQDIRDLAGNALPEGEPATDETYLVDNTAPVLSSFTRQTPATSPTNADTLIFRATFSEDVQNVGAADFENNSTTTATITNVTAVNARTYDITVSGGNLASFNGTVGLNLAAGQDVRDLAGNALPAGEPAIDHAYTVDNIAPVFASITRLDPAGSPTNADTLIFRATFNEAVQNVGAADFAVNGTTTATVSGVSAFDAFTYDITISGGDLASFNGTVGVNLAGGQDIRDLAGNALPAGEPATDETYMVDHSIPDTVIDNHPADLTNSVLADFAFSSPDATAVFECALDGAAFAACTSPRGYTGLGEGTHTFQVRAVDTAGNMDPTPASFSWRVDVTPPVVHSITDPSLNPTNAGQVWYRVSFSEAVVGVGVDDFSIHAEGITGARVVEVTGEGRNYTVVVGTGHGMGTLRLDVPETATVSDLAGNMLAGLPYTEGAVYAVRQATFADVLVSHWAWRFVERLHDAGLTTGCGTDPLVFCPEAAVKRSEMAVFLERGLHFPGPFVPPAGTGLVFGDVPAGYWAAGWIEALFADGLTTGCGLSPRVYCPEEAVSRAQMAVFLLRARHGAGYVPPAPAGIFGDVPPTHWAAAWIEQLFAEGITTGCSTDPLWYCPGEAVSRAQMAVFLVRTFALP